MAENERMGESANQRVGELANRQGDALPLPDGWVWATVEEIAERVNSGFPSGKHNTDGRGVPHLRPMNISPNGDIDLSLVKYVEVSNYDALRQGDVLFNNTNSPTWLGKTTYIRKNTNWAYSNHMTRVRLHPGFDSGWVAYALHHLFLTGFFRMNCRHHVNQASINTSFLSEKVSIPFPPVPEQHRIVAEIETQFTRLDAAVAALERAQANLRRYKASVLKTACEGRLVPTEASLARAEGRDYEPADQLLARILAERRVRWEADYLDKQLAKGKEPKSDKWKQKYKKPTPPDTENLPELPEGWAWASAGQMADVGTGATPLRSNRAYYEDGTIPWVKSSALNALFVGSADEFITELALAETNVKSFPTGTLLVAMYGEGKTRGKVSELKIDAATNQACAALLFDDLSSGCRPYIKIFFQKNYNDIRRLSSGGVQPNLNLSIIRGTAVPLPPLSEQHRIVAEVKRRLSVVTALERTVSAALARARRLRQAVLKQAFEGRLVPQHPDDEPASVLLEHISAQREARTPARGKQKAKQMQLPTVQ